MTNSPAMIANEIANWDMNDVRVLRNLISELRASCRETDEDPEAFIDMASLPTVEIPVDIDTSCPVWAMDVHGRCLVGERADSIETLDEIRA